MLKQQFYLLSKKISEASSLWRKVIESSWKELILVFLFVQLQAQALLFLIKLTPSNESVQLLGQLGLGSLSLMESAFLMILIPLRVIEIQQQKPPGSYGSHFLKFIGPITLEALRMTGFVILWSLLLIVPGLFKQLRWYFMPFIVVEDKKYDSGNVDPLDRSNQLVKGITFAIGLIALSDFAIQYGIDALGQSLQGYLQFFGLFSSGLLTLGVSIYTYVLLFCIYQQRSHEIPHEED